jgi:protocatechuate 3,4-dioxygenase beta subunit
LAAGLLLLGLILFVTRSHAPQESPPLAPQAELADELATPSSPEELPAEPERVEVVAVEPQVAPVEATAAPEPFAGWVIEGRVRDESGASVTGARVSARALIESPVYTDREGRFAFEFQEYAAAIRTESLGVVHASYPATTVAVSLPSDFVRTKTHHVEVVLKVGVNVEVTVLDKSHRPVEGATVVIREQAGDGAIISNEFRDERLLRRYLNSLLLNATVCATAVTDEGGIARLVIRAGDHFVMTWKSGFMCARDTNTVWRVTPEERQFTYILDKGCGLTGRIKDENGREAPGVLIVAKTVDSVNKTLAGNALSQADGEFELNGLGCEASRAHVVVHHEHLGSWFGRFEMPSPHVEITLQANRRFALSIVSAEEQARWSGNLSVEFSQIEPNAAAAANGTPRLFRFDIVDGHLSLSVPIYVTTVKLRSPGWDPVELHIADLPKVQDATVAVELRRERRFEVLVVDGETGRTISNCVVDGLSLEVAADGRSSTARLGALPTIQDDHTVFHFVSGQIREGMEILLRVNAPGKKQREVGYKTPGIDPPESVVVELEDL